MPTLPPVILEIRAQAARFYTTMDQVTAKIARTAEETEIWANEMNEKVSTTTEMMAENISRATQLMAVKSAAAAEDMAKQVIEESRQMDAQATAAVESMSKTITGQVEEMSAQTTAAMSEQTAKTAEAFKAQADEVVASQEKTAAAVESSTEAIVAALKEQNAASTRAAESTRVSGLDMQRTFIKTAETAVSSTGTMSAAFASAALKQAEAAKGAQVSLMGIADGITKVGVVTGIVVAGIGLDMAAHFQKSTNLLVTAGGEAKSNLDSVRQGILSIAQDTGTSSEQLSEGMYVMEKAGYRGAAGLAALRASAEGAKAENVDLGVMTQATTDILLDYGYKMGTAEDATKSSVSVVNQLVAASGAAKTTMRDYAASMAAVIPIASAAHISFAQVGGALATMTQHGQTAAQSSQNLANLIQSLIRPNNLASNAMQQFGIDVVSLGQHLGDAGLSGSLQMIHDKIIEHMGPDGLVVQDTMKKSASATSDLKQEMAKMPPELAKLSQGLLDGTTTQKEYLKASKDNGGQAGALADNFLSLYKASQGVNDAMKNGQPAMMTYQAALTKVMGNVTAARAATMLLMNDSQDLQRSISLVADAANASGQHIQTWAETQSQLSTQLDMAKQRAENLAIEIGTKLIPYANGALKGFEDLFTGFEKGNPLLLTAAGIIGGIMTVSLVKYTIQLGVAAAKTVTAMADMAASAMLNSEGFVKGLLANGVAVESLSTKAELAGQKVRGMGMAFAGIGTVATAAVVGLQVLNSMSQEVVVNADDMKKALADLALKGGDVGKLELDSQFTKWRTSAGMTTVNVGNLDDAIKQMTNPDAYGQFSNFFDGLRGAMGATKSDVGQLQDRFKSVGDQLGELVKGGQTTTAAQAFDKIAESFEKQGKSAQDALDSMPGYKEQLEALAHSMGVTLSPAEELDLAMGKLPAKMQEAAAANQTYTDSAGNAHLLTDQMKKAFDDLGISVEGEITDLGKLYDAMVKTGLANLSARDAAFHFGDAVTQADAKAQELTNKLGGNLKAALDDTGKDFSKTTEAGQAAEAQFSAVTQAGLQNASVMAHDTTKGLSDVTGALKDTYNGMVGTAEKFGLNSQAAEDLTRKVLGIPAGVSVDSWMNDYAKRMAEQTKGAIDNIPSSKTVTVTYETYKTEFDKVVGLPGQQIPSDIAKPGLPGGFTGGAVDDIMGMYDGGIVPGRAPSNPHTDNILAQVNGKPLKVRSGEYIVNEPQTKKNLPWLKAINGGLDMSHALAPVRAPLPGYGGSTPAAPHVTNTDNSRTITNHVSIQSTADARSLASEFSRMTSNM